MEKGFQGKAAVVLGPLLLENLVLFLLADAGGGRVLIGGAAALVLTLAALSWVLSGQVSEPAGKAVQPGREPARQVDTTKLQAHGVGADIDNAVHNTFLLSD